jgi:hypothetical protein
MILLQLRRVVDAAADGGSPSAAGGDLRVRVWVWVRVLGVGGLPWPPDLKGFSGAAAGPALVVECGRNGRRRRRRARRGGGGVRLGQVCGGGVTVTSPAKLG